MAKINDAALQIIYDVFMEAGFSPRYTLQSFVMVFKGLLRYPERPWEQIDAYMQAIIEIEKEVEHGK